MKRGATDYNLLIAVDKPSGITSHDVVNQIRNEYGEGRVGHMGTLDPLASGLLIVGIGSAARLNRFIELHDKTYIVKVKFGLATNTYDSEGEVIEEKAVPENIDQIVKDNINKLLDMKKQKPPIFSAIKINGKKAYNFAHIGQHVDLPEREIEVYSVKLIDTCTYEMHVSSGTYIRSLIHDFGQMIGVPAHVEELRRTKIGNISLDKKQLNPIDVLGFKTLKVKEECVKDGKNLKLNIKDEYVSIITDEKLLAIYKNDKPVCIFNNGIDL